MWQKHVKGSLTNLPLCSQCWLDDKMLCKVMWNDENEAKEGMILYNDNPRFMKLKKDTRALSIVK